MIFNVRDYGCRADGMTVDSPAIQAAIDDCAKAGGGRVLIPAGNYLVGKMVLKDHVTVEIAEGAYLTASLNREDYPASPGFPGSLYNQGVVIPGDDRSERVALFYAGSAKNIAIIGRGTIDGNDKGFLVKNLHPTANSPRATSRDQNLDRYWASGPDFKFRIMTLFFEDCEDVVIDGINLRSCSCYTVQMRSSTQIQINNVTIRNYILSDNADGLHFSSCTDVRITNCDLECGDDCIAIDTNDMRPARHYVIQNCTFVSRNNCFRIFTNLAPEDVKRRLVGYGYVSDIAISNCVVKDASSFVYINADCGDIRRISVTNACGKIIRQGTTFLITAHNAKVRQVTFSNWNFSSRGVGYLYADRPDSIYGVKLLDLDIEVNPSTQLYGNGVYMPAAPNGRPSYWFSHYMPYFLQMVEAEDVLVRDLRVRWGETDIHDMAEMEGPPSWPAPLSKEPHWPAIWAERIRNLTLDTVDADAFGGHPCTLRLDSVKGAKLRDCSFGAEAVSADENCADIRL